MGTTRGRLTLVGDIGGTNARLALARDGGLMPDSMARFAGDDHPCFDTLLRGYLGAQGNPALAAACLAVAGPVAGDMARLTNRDWQISTAGLAATSGAGRVRLINDLTALGFAAPGLRGDQLTVLRAGGGAESNGQALVLGAGTGVNLCALRQQAGRITCLEAEAGHTALPATLMAALPPALQTGQHDAPATLEDLFSGRGLARLHRGLTGHDLPPCAIADAAAQPGPARDTLDLYVRLLGLLCRELALHYLPRDGIFLAGSVARNAACHIPAFENGFLANPLLRQIPQAMPVFLIRDDMAALAGCLTAISDAAA